MSPPFPHRHLLGIDQLSAADILHILDEAELMAKGERARWAAEAPLAGLTQLNLFFENSTRTAMSFELAGKRLGAIVANFQTAGSSLQKGETLLDTALTLGAMQPDLVVIRHGESGAPHAIAEAVGCPVINAGDGTNEHPTQALLDAFTMRRRKGRIEGLKVAICGDVRHSRVARSNMLALAKLGAEVRLVGPEALLPEDADNVFTDMDEGIAGADVVMMLRIQRERMEEALAGSLNAFHERFGLTYARLAGAAPDALVMHPGPINRGVEIEGTLADDRERSAILDQVANGVAVRMACLELLTRSRRRA